MNIAQLHSWELTAKQAVALQKELADRIVARDQPGEVGLVAGVDVGFEDKNTITRAAVAVLDYPNLNLVDYAIARTPTRFPYIPGLLSFREIPAILEAFTVLKTVPDLLLCDGQGIAHPRRFGIACHLGLILGIPSIGVGKSRLCGTHDAIPEKAGARKPLIHKDETIGMVLRTRTGIKPIYVSVGHHISLKTAVDYVVRCQTRYRLPETTRWADRLASHSIPEELGPFPSSP